MPKQLEHARRISEYAFVVNTAIITFFVISVSRSIVDFCAGGSPERKTQACIPLLLIGRLGLLVLGSALSRPGIICRCNEEVHSNTIMSNKIDEDSLF